MIDLPDMTSISPPQNATRALHFLWLNLDLPAAPDPDDGSLRAPMPAKYIGNIRQAAERHPETQVMLWIDSRRLTGKQRDFLQRVLEEDMPNVHLKDLRSIPAYDREALYNQTETDPAWRNIGQSALIWRQVDAAKVLISLQGDIDQSFFADLDHAHLDIGSREVQGMLEKRGLMIGNGLSSGAYFENQLWGFTRDRRAFFEGYYTDVLKSAYRGENGYNALLNRADRLLLGKERISPSEISFVNQPDGSKSEQPGHHWQDGRGGVSAPRLVDNGELTRVFNAKARPPQPARPARDAVWGPPALQPGLATIRIVSQMRKALKTLARTIL